MFLGCYRAADYLAQRPDWDGRTLVVAGTSQGGLQSIVTAAIYPKITALMADVPAGCDTTGLCADRAPGWPYSGSNMKNARDQKIMDTSRYFDAVNFASRVKCPALVATGLIDVTCPPAGVLAACNQLQGPKEVLVMVNAGHSGSDHAQVLYDTRSNAWIAELLKGNPVPPK
jgi:cephalosporin-C deacetylase